MKKLLAGVSLLLFAGAVHAQERVPPDQAQKFAKLFAEKAASLGNLPIKSDVDTEKPFAVKANMHAAMIIPDKKLTEDAITKAAKEVTPVAQLWLLQLSPVVEGKATPDSKLRLVTITIDNQDHAISLCLLGVRKNADGALELVLYANDQEPLLKLPLKQATVTQELPIELEAKKGENETGILTINVMGKYQATLTVTRPEP